MRYLSAYYAGMSINAGLVKFIPHLEQHLIIDDWKMWSTRINFSENNFLNITTNWCDAVDYSLYGNKFRKHSEAVEIIAEEV